MIGRLGMCCSPPILKLILCKIQGFLSVNLWMRRPSLPLSSSPPLLPCVDSKRPRVYVQKVPVCAGTTPACGNTCARGAGTHGDVLNPHTGVFQCATPPHTTPQHTYHTTHAQHTPQHTPQQPHTTHHTPHTTYTTQHTHNTRTTHNTTHMHNTHTTTTQNNTHTHTQQHTETDRQTDSDRENKRRQDGRQEKRREEVVVWFFFFLFKITRPSNNFEYSKLPFTILRAF